jgi:transcriptional adapter 2-alpha
LYVSFPSCVKFSIEKSVDEALLRKRIQDLQQYRRVGLRTAADIEQYEADIVKRVSIVIVGVRTALVYQHVLYYKAQVKATVARDWYSSERLQHRAGNGRQSSGPDTRRASHASFAPDSDGRKSNERELTPKNGSAPNGTGPIRKPRAYTHWALVH